MAKKKWTDKDYLYFRDLILKKRKVLHLEISNAKDKADEILETSTSNALYSSHMADASSDHVELEKSYYMIARNKKFSIYLDKALGMIEDKSFGVCQNCEELIQKERLEEVPHTTKCFDCKSNR